eukprot:6191758-Pleurochrysis_carterae.AAC.3
MIARIAIEPDHFPFCLELVYSPFYPCREYFVRNLRSALLLLARMHKFPVCTRAASVLAERSRSAPQVLGSRSAHGRYCLTAPLPRSYPIGASSPRTRVRSQTALVCIVIKKCFPPGSDGHSPVDPGKDSV